MAFFSDPQLAVVGELLSQFRVYDETMDEVHQWILCVVCLLRVWVDVSLWKIISGVESDWCWSYISRRHLEPKRGHQRRASASRNCAKPTSSQVQSTKAFRRLVFGSIYRSSPRDKTEAMLKAPAKMIALTNIATIPRTRSPRYGCFCRLGCRPNLLRLPGVWSHLCSNTEATLIKNDRSPGYGLSYRQAIKIFSNNNLLPRNRSKPSLNDRSQRSIRNVLRCWRTWAGGAEI